MLYGIEQSYHDVLCFRVVLYNTHARPSTGRRKRRRSLILRYNNLFIAATTVMDEQRQKQMTPTCT